MNTIAIIPNNPFNKLTEPFLAAQDVGIRTKEAYASNIGYFFNYLQDNNIVIDGVEDIIAYKDYLIDQGKKAATVNAYLTAVKRFFAWLEMKGHYRDIAKSVKSVKGDKDYKKLPLTQIQWTLLKESLTREDIITRRDLLLLALGVGVGLRTIEMSRLNVEDIQFHSGRWVAMITGKGSRGREQKPVILHENLFALIKSFMQLRNITSGALFTSLSNNSGSCNNDRLTTAGLRYIIKRRFAAVGINDSMITAHSLRHSMANWLLDAEVPIHEVQKAMRHDSIESTMIYVNSRSLYDNPASLKIDVLGVA